MDFESAMDHCILQKILPRVQGSSIQINNILRRLFEIFADYDHSKDGEYESVHLKYLEKVMGNSSIAYPKSARKVAGMMKRFEIEGFTSYWV